MKKGTIISIVLLIAFIGFVFWLIKTPGRDKPSIYKELASCIKDSGATFYGAFWCPHCQDQKAMFGSAQKLLPYVECSTPDRKQNQICTDAKIASYPTWVFADGSRITGSHTLENLAARTSCVLPGETVPPSVVGTSTPPLASSTMTILPAATSTR